MKIAICIGHSRMIRGRRDGGATDIHGKSEWEYNSALGRRIVEDLKTLHGEEAVLVDYYKGAGYSTAMAWLAGYLQNAGVTMAVELHFNSASNDTANGHEWLYWHRSQASRSLAANLDAAMKTALPSLRARGIKPVSRGGRGAEFLASTLCPAVICEPFFGSCPSDVRIANLKQDAISAAIARGLVNTQRQIQNQ